MMVSEDDHGCGGRRHNPNLLLLVHISVSVDSTNINSHQFPVLMDTNDFWGAFVWWFASCIYVHRLSRMMSKNARDKQLQIFRIHTRISEEHTFSLHFHFYISYIFCNIWKNLQNLHMFDCMDGVNLDCIFWTCSIQGWNIERMETFGILRVFEYMKGISTIWDWLMQYYYKTNVLLFASFDIILLGIIDPAMKSAPIIFWN